jgi:hypothetical protein
MITPPAERPPREPQRNSARNTILHRSARGDPFRKLIFAGVGPLQPAKPNANIPTLIAISIKQI